MILDDNNFWLENIFFLDIKSQLNENVIADVEIGTEQSDILSNHVWIYLDYIQNTIGDATSSPNFR